MRRRARPNSRNQELLQEYEFTRLFAPRSTSDDLDFDVNAELRAADRLFKSHPRLGMIAAIRAALLALASDSNVRDPLLLPLHRLARALEDLNDGIVHDAFKVVPKRGGTELTLDDLEFRISVALAVRMFEAAGDSRTNACLAVARRLARNGFGQQRARRSSGASITAETINNWVERKREFERQLVARGGLPWPRLLYTLLFYVEARPPLPRAGPERSRWFARHIIEVALPALYGHLAASNRRR